MVAVTGCKEARPNASFLPLTVDYQEKHYAAGRVPGGFFRREGRADGKGNSDFAPHRPGSLRPLFSRLLLQRNAVLATVVSYNPEIDADIPAMIGASAAMALSGIPFAGPIGAARVAKVDGKVVVSPTATQLAESDLNLVIAGTKKRRADGRVGSQTKLTEEDMLEAVMAGHRENAGDH